MTTEYPWSLDSSISPSILLAHRHIVVASKGGYNDIQVIDGRHVVLSPIVFIFWTQVV